MAQQAPQLPMIGGQPLTQEKLKQIVARMNQLRAEGHTQDSSPELANMTKLIMHIQQIQQQQRAAAAAAQAAAQSGPPQVNGTPAAASPAPPAANGTPQPAATPAAVPAPSPAAAPQPVASTSAATPAPAPAAAAPTPLVGSAAPTAPTPVVANGDGTAVAAASSAAVSASVNFTPEQLATLRVQILAFRLLSQNQPIPANIQAAIYDPPAALKLIASMPGGDDDPAVVRERALAEEEPLEQVEDKESLVYPYNSFLHPLKALHTPFGGAVKRSLLIPTLLPPGLDPQQLIDERNRIIQARVAQRVKELENLPATFGQEDYAPLPRGVSCGPGPELAQTTGAPFTLEQIASQKLKALIELKSLQLLSKQKSLREDVVRGFNQATSLSLPVDRAQYRRSKKQTLRDARATEELERQQKAERERRAKQKHVDHLTLITTHGRDLNAAHRAHQAKFAKLGRALQKFHTDAEKDEQRRVERVSKERLKALRADDEEGYLKLIDTAKDTRITHLLRQTDAFLDSLAAAVAVQQNEAMTEDEIAKQAAEQDSKVEEKAIDESAFGAAPVFAEEGEKEKVDYYSVAHKIKESVTAQPSILVGGQLKAYQLKGLEWMVSLYNNHVNGILADEMGLGKTIQTLSLITYLIEVKKVPGPYLVIVPLSTMPNWISEFERWAPSVKMLSYKGTPNQRKQTQAEIRQGDFQVLLTTYEYIIKDRPLLAKIKWVHMIIDEGHRMKNASSKLSVTLTTYYYSRYRLILTGTPLQNNLPELWALLNFVLPKIFGSVKSFDEWFNAPFANTGGQDKIEINEEESLLVIRRLHKVLRPFLLRRLKKDVESDLPDKVERVIKCKMSSLQLKLTKQIRDHGMIFTEMGSTGDGKKTTIRGLQNQIMQLRKICNHPFCFQEVEDSIDPTHQDYAALYRVAGKFEILDRILPKLFATGHRVLMFFQMTTVMTIFEDYLNFRRIEHLRLDGTTKHEDRSGMLKAFNDPNSKYPIFILSTRAGGLGLNLQTADTVIIFDSDWNPHQDLQAQDRAHRIGQKKEVRILRLVTERSVEEQVMAGASRKIEMDKKVIQAGRYDNKSTAEERDEFLRALLDAADEEPEDDDDLDDAEALNEAIARTEEEKLIFAQMDKARREGEEAAWAAAGNTGKLPERLIQEHELPEVYRIEHTVAVVGADAVAAGERRARNNPTYDDGLSEEQWLKTMEEDEDDAAGRRPRGRAARNKKAVIDRGSDYSGSDSDSDGPSSRKRKSGASSANGDDEAGGGERKKRKVTLSPEQETLKCVFDLVLDSLDAVVNTEYGHLCTGIFKVVPDRRQYPDYYRIITQPISLKEIHKRIDSGKYDSEHAFAADVNLMLRNAMTYNAQGSVIYNDAVLLKDTFDRVLAEQVANRAAAVGPGPGPEQQGMAEDEDEDEE